MFTHLMRESRIYGHNKGHLESCKKCKEFKAEFDRNLASISKKIIYKNLNTELRADRIEMDLVTKNSKILMDKKTKKVKVITLN